MKSRRSRRSTAGRLPEEFALIARYFAPLATSRDALSLKDDCALLRVPKGHELVLTTDAIVESVHFLKTDPADAVARKALRVNLSDLAAKGATPLGYLMALLLPSATKMAWLSQFCAGLGRDQKEFSVSLLGGDTSRTPGPLAVAIAAFGSVPRGRMIARSGAKPGDLILVSGTVGDAGAGLDILKKGGSRNLRGAGVLVSRYRVPSPRLDLGRRLLGVANAAADVSDGLVADLGHIADASGVRIEIDAARIPLSVALRTWRGDSISSIARAATSGDDYEIAFACPPSKAGRLARIARESGVAITEIGRATKGRGVALLGADGRPLRLARTGYAHF